MLEGPSLDRPAATWTRGGLWGLVDRTRRLLERSSGQGADIDHADDTAALQDMLGVGVALLALLLEYKETGDLDPLAENVYEIVAAGPGACHDAIDALVNAGGYMLQVFTGGDLSAQRASLHAMGTDFARCVPNPPGTAR